MYVCILYPSFVSDGLSHNKNIAHHKERGVGGVVVTVRRDARRDVDIEWRGAAGRI